MKTKYPTKKLGEILELCDAGTWGDESSEGVPLLRSSNMQGGELVLDDLKYISVPKDKLDRYILRKGDILVTKSSGSVNHIGKSLYITKEMDRKYGFSNFTQRLRGDKNQVLSKWIYYKISNPATRDFLLGASQTTTGLRNLKIPALKELEILLPPLSEQKKIVAKLEKILAKVSEAKKLRAEAQEVANQLLPAELHKIFKEGKKKGWEEKTFEDVLVFKTGKLDSNAMVPGGKYPFFTCAQKTYEIDSYSFDQKAVLLAGNNAAGKYSVKFYDGKFDAYQRTYVISIRDKVELDYTFLTNYISYILNDLKELSVGANTKFLTMRILNSLKIPIPPLVEQKNIVARLDSISEKVRQLQEYQKTTEADLLALEQSILSKAFSGKFI